MAIANLKINKLSVTDLIFVGVFAAVDLGRLIALLFFNTPKILFFYDFGVVFLTLMLMMSSYPIRFINLRYSAIWLILCLIYILPGDRPLAYFGLLLFLTYHIIRLRFIKKYNREFIPPEPSKSRFIDVYNEDEKRWSNKDDNRYMRFFTWWGLIILVGCIIASGR